MFGTTKYGKTFTPVRIKSLSHLYSEFGEYGSIIDVYISIKGMVNGVNIYCVKISGHSSKCCLNINGDSGRTELYTIGCKTRNDRMTQIKKVINSLSKNDKLALKMKRPVRCKVGD